MDTEKKARGNAMELMLSVCSGLRKVPAKTPEEIAYNNALGDVFDYIIKNERGCLIPGTIQRGMWERNTQSTATKLAITYVVIGNEAYPVYNKEKRTSKNQLWTSELDRAMLSDVTTYLNDRKQLRLKPIAEGQDEQDFYFCPTCYAIVGVHDEDTIEHSGYCPDCGQKLSWQNYHEKRMKNRIEQLMQDGILTAEKREGILFCCLSKEISFVAPMPAIYDDEHIIDSIFVVLSHPGTFGIFKDKAESIWKILCMDNETD